MDAAFARNKAQLDRDASRLEREAANLRAARAGKLDAARRQRQQVERDLAEARSRLKARVDEAMLARRDSTRNAAHREDLRAIRDIANDKTEFRAACDSITSGCRSLKKRADGLAALTSAKPKEADSAPHAHDPEVAAYAESIRGLKRARRRGYLRVWLIALPVAVAAFFALAAMSVSWAPAVAAVPVALHLWQWLLWRKRLGGGNSIEANCRRIDSKANGIISRCAKIRDGSVISAFDKASSGAATLEALT